MSKIAIRRHKKRRPKPPSFVRAPVATLSAERVSKCRAGVSCLPPQLQPRPEQPRPKQPRQRNGWTQLPLHDALRLIFRCHRVIVAIGPRIGLLLRQRALLTKFSARPIIEQMTMLPAVTLILARHSLVTQPVFYRGAG
jgi:hypothetical protein